MQSDIETRKRKKRRKEIDAAIEQLVSMGFERSKGKRSQLTNLFNNSYEFNLLRTTNIHMQKYSAPQ